VEEEEGERGRVWEQGGRADEKWKEVKEFPLQFEVKELWNHSYNSFRVSLAPDATRLSCLQRVHTETSKCEFVSSGSINHGGDNIHLISQVLF
jgi:hypothetical protein